jgi:hypothetical protein
MEPFHTVCLRLQLQFHVSLIYVVTGATVGRPLQLFLGAFTDGSSWNVSVPHKSACG